MTHWRVLSRKDKFLTGEKAKLKKPPQTLLILVKTVLIRLSLTAALFTSLWHFTPSGEGEFFGTDTFVIEEGKIAVQTIASLLYERYVEQE